VIIKNEPLDKSEADWGLVKHGVPQGSILASLLFALYINDLPLIIKYHNSDANSQTTLFVDDTSIIASNSNHTLLGKNLNLIFTSVMKWFKALILIKLGKSLLFGISL
jgi:hypothetical protein